MASFLEDDSMELNHDDEFDAPPYISQMTNGAHHCCCCLQHHLNSTHSFQNVQVPPIAHMGNMFRPHCNFQSKPEFIKSNNTIEMKPLDLSVHSLRTPVHNEFYENSCDTGFDSPINCENMYIGSVPVAIEPILHTFQTSSPQANRFNVEPVVGQLPSVDPVHPTPACSQTECFDTDLELNFEDSSHNFNVEEEDTVHREHTASSSSNQRNPITYTREQAADTNLEHQFPNTEPSTAPKEEVEQQMDEDSDNDDVISIYACSNGSLSPILDEPMIISKCNPLQFRNLNYKEEEPKPLKITTNVIIPPLQMHISSGQPTTTSLAGFRIPKRNPSNDNIPNSNNTSLADQHKPNRFSVPAPNFQNGQTSTATPFNFFPTPPVGVASGLSIATQNTTITNALGRPCFRFLNDKCPNLYNCKYSHKPLPPPELIQRKLRSWPQALGYHMYTSFVVRCKALFKCYFSIFCDFFTEQPQQPQRLIEMVSLCVQNIDETELLIYFTQISVALERCGIEKSAAISQIIMANQMITHAVVDALIELCTTNTETIGANFSFLQQWAIVTEYQFPENCIKRLIDSVLVSKNSGVIALILRILDRTPKERTTHIQSEIMNFSVLIQI